MNTRTLAASLMCLWLSAAAQAGVVVESMMISFEGDVLYGTFTELTDLSFGMIVDGEMCSPEHELWLEADVGLTAGDIGTTFVYDNAAVGEIRNQFADGDVLDRIGWGFDHMGGMDFVTFLQSEWEEYFVADGFLAPQDLAATGFQEIHVTILDYEAPYATTDDFGSPAMHFGLFTRFDFVVVPEPGALALFATAGCLLLRRRRA